VAAIEKIGSEFAGVPVVLTAGIYYNDPENIRYQTSLEFAETARDEGVPAVFIDASPEKAPDAHPNWKPTWVADAHRASGAVVLRAETPGIATQRQQGVFHAVANGAEKVVGTESEKPLVPKFAGELALALDSADVLVIGRTPEAEASLPPVQRRTERLAGWILTETMEMPADSLAGPRGFTVAGAETLMDYPATEPGLNNWLYMYMSVLAARARGLRVGGTSANFVYPAGMVAEETDNPVFDTKRLDQFHMQLRALLPEARTLPMDIRQSDIASVTEAHLPLVGPDKDLDYRLERFGILEGNMASIFRYGPPKAA
jgi:hypothetical protein